MNTIFNKSAYKVISLLLKTTIFMLSIWYISIKLIDADLTINFASQLPKLNSSYFVLALLLIVVNWGLEAYKWKYLIRKLEVISFPLAFKSILAGVAISIFTPNRIGEFAGRVFYLKSHEKSKATLISILGSTLQLSVTILMGGIASIIYFNQYQVSVLNLLNNSGLILMLSMVSIVSIAMIGMYIKRKNLSKKLARFIFLFSYTEIARAFGISALRYLVFSFQYYLVLILFGIDIGWMNTLLIIACIFFVSAAIPSFAISEISVRGATAIYFFNVVSQDHFAIVAASVLIWIINLALPAFVGTAFIWNLNFSRTINNGIRT